MKKLSHQSKLRVFIKEFKVLLLRRKMNKEILQVKWSLLEFINLVRMLSKEFWNCRWDLQSNFQVAQGNFKVHFQRIKAVLILQCQPKTTFGLQYKYKHQFWNTCKENSCLHYFGFTNFKSNLRLIKNLSPSFLSTDCLPRKSILTI